MSHLEEGTLTALIDGEIPSDALPAITAHLEACAACRSLLQELRELAGEADTLITRLGDGQASPAAVPGVIPIHAGRRLRTSRLVAWAATVAMAAGLGYWAGLPDATPPAVLAEGAEFTVPSPIAENRLAAADAAPPPDSAPAAQSVPAMPGRRETTTVADVPAVAPPTAALAQPQPEALGRTAVRRDQEAAKMADATAGARAGLAANAAAPPAAPALASERVAALRDRQEIAVESFAPIAFVDAVARMGGTLRLVDGLVPDRLEASTATVRVIYPLLNGELVLEQRRIGDSISVALRGPISADSLAVLRRRVR